MIRRNLLHTAMVMTLSAMLTVPCALTFISFMVIALSSIFYFMGWGIINVK